MRVVPEGVLMLTRVDRGVGLLMAMAGLAVVGVGVGVARGQCSYAITQSSGAIVPGDTDAGNHGDDTTNAVSLPFSFSFYGTAYNTAYVCSNGWMSFSGSSGNGYYNNCL